MAIIKSDNTKGNPYHKSADGKFTSKTGNGPEENKKNKLSQIFVTQKGEKLKGLFTAKDGSSSEETESNADFWKKVDAEKGKAISSETYNNKTPISSAIDDDDKTSETKESKNLNVDKETETVINGLDYQSTYKDAFNDPTLDKDKLQGASEEDLKLLLKAKSVLNEQLTDTSLAEANNKYFYDLWQTPVKPSDYYLGKKEKIQAKKDYFLYDYKGADKDAKIASLDAFVEAGKNYETAKKAFDAKYGEAQAIVDKYKHDYYTEERKTSAIHIGGKGYPILSSSSAVKEGQKVFGPNADKVISDFKKNDPEALNAIIEYTGSYSSINEPLRGVHYVGSKATRESFVKRTDAMTRIIDASTLGVDCWLQRGTDEVIDTENGINITSALSQAELDAYVGKSFEHRSFFSAAANKYGGFSQKNIIINTYCPGPTKGLYIASVSQFKNENEVILQRGYKYKITKAEKSHGQIYLDVEVLIDSDKNRYNHEQLVELANKYISGW